VTVYGDRMKMCKDFALNFGDKRTECCITTMHCLTLSFSTGNFDQKQQDCHPPAILFSLVSLTEDKTKG
jgi:hypothetical protein